MPFFGVNPPANRVAGLFGALNATLASAPLNAIVDATAQALLGAPAFYKDSLGRISVLAYAQAFASIPYGAALMHQAGGATVLNSAGASTMNGFDTAAVAAATTGVGGYPAYFAGIAAASVVNTGYFFWRYISGFVPDALLSSGIASGHMLTLGATTANVLSSISNLNATAASNATIQIPFAFSMGIGPTNGGTASGLGSVFLQGWYL